MAERVAVKSRASTSDAGSCWSDPPMRPPAVPFAYNGAADPGHKRRRNSVTGRTVNLREGLCLTGSASSRRRTG